MTSWRPVTLHGFNELSAKMPARIYLVNSPNQLPDPEGAEFDAGSLAALQRLGLGSNGREGMADTA